MSPPRMAGAVHRLIEARRALLRRNSAERRGAGPRHTERPEPNTLTAAIQALADLESCAAGTPPLREDAENDAKSLALSVRPTSIEDVLTAMWSPTDGWNMVSRRTFEVARLFCRIAQRTSAMPFEHYGRILNTGAPNYHVVEREPNIFVSGSNTAFPIPTQYARQEELCYDDCRAMGYIIETSHTSEVVHLETEAEHVFRAQPYRAFFPVFVMDTQVFHYYIFDRKGGIRCHSMNYHSNPGPFCTLIGDLLFANPEALGYAPNDSGQRSITPKLNTTGTD